MMTDGTTTTTTTRDEEQEEDETSESESFLRPWTLPGENNDEVAVAEEACLRGPEESPRHRQFRGRFSTLLLKWLGGALILPLSVVGIVAPMYLIIASGGYVHQKERSYHKKLSLDEMKDLYGQSRSTKLVGKSPDYVEINTYKDRHRKRQEDMRQLDRVRFGACGGFDKVVAAVHSLADDDPTAGTNWRQKTSVSGDQMLSRRSSLQTQ
jgi:hypothetical protein